MAFTSYPTMHNFNLLQSDYVQLLLDSQHVYSKEKPLGSVRTHRTRTDFYSSVKIVKMVLEVSQFSIFTFCKQGCRGQTSSPKHIVEKVLAHSLELWVLSGLRLYLMEHKLQLYQECCV